jgi:glycine cleavage system T protein
MGNYEAVEQTRSSQLHKSQQEAGAVFGLYYGWEMPRFYSNAVREHLAVRANGGLLDTSYGGAIKVYGSEAIQFLNGLVTNNVKSLEIGKGMQAAFLTGHGKVKALCRVLNLGGAYLIVNDPQTHEAVFKYVFPFSYAGDFKVEDVSDEYRSLSVQGPKARLVMKEICFEPVPSLAEHDWFETLIAGHRATVTRASHTGEIGFDILVRASELDDIWDFILLKGEFHSIVPCGLEALNSLRIEAGIPIYGVDIDDTNMMLETGLQNAVSLTKGCYTGQEAVAMATYRGHVSKKLSGLTVAGDLVPTPGNIVKKDGKEIGFVTSSLQSPSLGSVVALAYVKYGFFEPGNDVEIQSDSAILPALVAELPFFHGSETASKS